MSENALDPRKVVLVSGGFDPVHSGHIQMFKHAAQYGRLIVALNSDEWLVRKKGAAFMDWEERFSVISALKYVDAVVTVDDSDETVCEAIRRIKPDIFCNGGDRNETNTPESDLCAKTGIQVVYHVGGSKRNHSSRILGAWDDRHFQPRPWGGFRVLYKSDEAWTKTLDINPRSATSLQRHASRAEWQLLVEGQCYIQIGSKILDMEPGVMYEIKTGEAHRLQNISRRKAVVMEMAYGPFVDENDIERLADKYGRV